MSTGATIAVLAIMTTVIVAVIGLQTFWISRSLDRLEGSLDRLDTRLDGFQTATHSDLATLTNAVTDLRERVARIESAPG
jgi:uncharacterized protein YoxC